MAHLLSRSRRAPSRAGLPPGVDAQRCERPVPSRMTRDLQLVYYASRLKAIMGEAELHLLRQRMNLGRINKARRGELFTTVPMGYIRRPGDGIELDPDSQVQAVLRLVFDKFDELGTTGAVLRYLAKNQIRLGVRLSHGPDAGRLTWRAATRSVLSKILRHPIYSGCYVYGLTKNQARGHGTGRS